MFDIVGIGAMNVDFIATRSKLQSRSPDLIPEIAKRFEHGTERHVDLVEVDKTIAGFGLESFEVFLGGSAFNTIHAAARIGAGLKLGFVGVAGDARGASTSFVEEMEALAIDTSLVGKEPSIPAGRCISFISDGERSLLTTPGANVRLAGYIRARRTQLSKVLTNAKIVHLTSLFDAESPTVLVQLLQKAKKKNPWLRVSFDPGHEWVKARAKWLFPLLRLSSYVFLNNREFVELGRLGPSSSDIDIASSILNHCGDAGILVVVKRYDCISIFQRLQGRTICRQIENQVLQNDEIEDATGAGDVFAAGFLTGLLIPGLEISNAVDLGLRLARAKLTSGGTTGFGKFPELFRGVLDAVFAGSSKAYGKKPNIVFLGHGRNQCWREVRDYLQGPLHLSCRAFESESHSGESITNVLEDLLRHASFAVIVLTAEDETKSGALRARQNVLHEIGLFQGRLGFNRVALLKQNGLEDFSNIQGLQVLYFHDGDISATFHRLEEHLQKAGLVQRPPIN